MSAGLETCKATRERVPASFPVLFGKDHSFQRLEQRSVGRFTDTQRPSSSPLYQSPPTLKTQKRGSLESVVGPLPRTDKPRRSMACDPRAPRAYSHFCQSNTPHIKGLEENKGKQSLDQFGSNRHPRKELSLSISSSCLDTQTALSLSLSLSKFTKDTLRKCRAVRRRRFAARS